MRYKLKDLAEIERVREGKEYPKGTILVQLSVSDGETVWHEGGTTSAKYAAITLKSDLIKQRFLYHYIKSTIAYYKALIITGLNIQIVEIENYPIEFPLIDEMRGNKR